MNMRAATHQNHGLLTASRHSIDEAAFWFIALERCCQQQLLIEAQVWNRNGSALNALATAGIT